MHEPPPGGCQPALARLWNPTGFSPPKDVPLAPRVGAAAQRAGLRVDADGDHARAHPVGAEHLQLVPARREIVADAWRNAIFDLQHARLALVVVERAERMQ